MGLQRGTLHAAKCRLTYGANKGKMSPNHSPEAIGRERTRILKDPHISFIGGGNMAQCLLRGLINAGRDGDSLTASDPDAGCREAVAGLGANAMERNQDAVDRADVVVLAVKPQALPSVLDGLRMPADRLLVSICAGVPIAGIAAATAADQPIVRTMPNTPALLRAGVTALCASDSVSEAQRGLAEGILAAVGKTVWVEDEALLDAVTAVSGSGPAYFFHLMEAMIEAGRKLGLPDDLAATLTVETALGAALMARQGDAAPGELRRRVTSPGGTTEAALNTLNRRQVHESVIEALGAACGRSRELAREFQAP